MKPIRFLPIFPALLGAAFLLTPASALASHAHSFHWLEEPSEKTLEHCIAEMNIVLRSAHHLVAGPLGHSEPIVEPLHLAFNGIGAAAQDPFEFPGASADNACETARKPYDKIVIAALLVARDHFPPEVLRLTSDGDPYFGDWDRGVDLYRQAFDREPPPLTTIFAASSEEALAEEEGYDEGEYYEEENVARDSPWLAVLLTWGPVLLIVLLWILFMRRSGMFKNQRERIQQHSDFLDRSVAFMDGMEEKMERLTAVIERLEERQKAPEVSEE